MDTLTIEIQPTQSYKKIVLTGAADMLAAQELKKKLEVLTAEGCPVLVMELSGLSFICSMALGALIYAHHRCLDRNGILILVNPCRAVMMLMQTTQLDNFFSICQNPETAENLICEFLQK